MNRNSTIQYLCIGVGITMLLSVVLSSKVLGETRGGVSKTEAVATIRAEIRDGFPGIPAKEIEEYKEVSLDPDKWGQRYWCFRFPSHGSTHYYINKTSGFVQAVLPVKADKLEAAEIFIDSLGSNLPHFQHKYTKREQEDAYLFTIRFDPKMSQTGNSYGLILRVHEGNDREHPKYYYPEHKVIARVQKIENVASAQFIIRKADLKKHEWVCPVFTGANWGGGPSLKMADIPTEKDDLQPNAPTDADKPRR